MQNIRVLHPIVATEICVADRRTIERTRVKRYTPSSSKLGYKMSYIIVAKPFSTVIFDKRLIINVLYVIVPVIKTLIESI